MTAARFQALAFFGFMATARVAAALTRCVPLSHPGACDQHYTTIQDAVSAASDGDTLLVAAGTYSESVTVSKAIALKGAQAGGVPVPRPNLAACP